MIQRGQVRVQLRMGTGELDLNCHAGGLLELRDARVQTVVHAAGDQRDL